MNEKEKKCLFLIPEKGKWGINEHLKPLKPIYNGAGWFIEEKHRPTVEQISHQANMRYIEWPLTGESFEELRRRNKREFLSENSIKLRLAIDALKATLKIDNLNTEELLKEEYRENLDKISEGKKLIEQVEEYTHLQEQIKYAENEEAISKIKPILSIVSIGERIKSHNKALEKYRGKKHLGLCVKTITEFNDKMLGLRKLILLAAAPNVGKTALTIQLANEVLLTEPDACLLYVSLEMDAEEIFTRMMLYFSGLEFKTYALGSRQIEGENGYQNLFNEEELRKIAYATEQIEKIGDRLQIIDMSFCTNISPEKIIGYVDKLKNQTGCKRAIVIIDYLQVWPIPEATRLSDIEADKWRIGEIKKIRDSLNEVNQDPVIVISEARKPSESGNVWGGDLSDVMGSARGTYTPDAVLLLNQLPDKTLGKLWKDKKMPEIFSNGEDDNDSKIKDFLTQKGIAICSLKMSKGRDGMERFNTSLAFHFRRNKFEPVNWDMILGLAMEEKNKKQKR